MPTLLSNASTPAGFKLLVSSLAVKSRLGYPLDQVMKGAGFIYVIIRRVLWGRATRKADAEAQRATPLKPD
jgi:hypothetical protein